MARQKTARKNAAGKKGRQPKVPPLVQRALQVTWQLNGAIKNIQIAYIRACKLLHHVREEKLWAELKHPDMESYAWARLKLKRSSLYDYLNVYDWMAEFQPDWLLPHPKGFIPEFSDLKDVMWMDKELKRTDLQPAKRAGLEDLRAKGLKGELREGELARWRQQGRGMDASVKSFLSKLRLLRTRGAQLAGIPPAAIADLDAAISAIENAVTGKA